MSESGTRLYFAYGSNMYGPQMEARCPGAKFLRVGRIEGYRFLINSRGVATVVPEPAGTVHGLIWEITSAHRKTLDRCEGAARHIYGPEMIDVLGEANRADRALIYIAADARRGSPRPGYLEKIGPGSNLGV